MNFIRMYECCRIRKNETSQILHADDPGASVMTQDKDLRVFTNFSSWRLLPEVCGDKISYYNSVKHQRGHKNERETLVVIQTFLYMLFSLVLKTIL